MRRRLLAVALLWVFVVVVLLMTGRNDRVFLGELAVLLGVAGSAVGLLVARDRFAPRRLAHDRRRDARAAVLFAGFVFALAAVGAVVAAVRALS